jgi:hypothetical protein
VVRQAAFHYDIRFVTNVLARVDASPTRRTNTASRMG